MQKRTFLKMTALATLSAWMPWGNGFTKPSLSLVTGLYPWSKGLRRGNEFVLPNLPYAFDALEPAIDTQTMEIHHGKHHAAYVSNLNKAIAGTSFETMSLEDICLKVTEASPAIRNNAGGHWNHSFFWNILNGNRTAETTPQGALAEAINASFGSFEQFKTKFGEAAKGRFGSGWAWLVVNFNKQLIITSTPNQDNPLMANLVKTEELGLPILALDVWEHAYYLKYQNKRADYVEAFWQVVNWNQVSDYYNQLFK